jgi:molybdate transport system substrate-binding protein
VLGASSLKEGLSEVRATFERDSPGWEVRVSFAGSQELSAQVHAGAPADVIATASKETMERLSSRKLVDTQSVRAFASTTLVIVQPARAEPVRNWEELARPKLRLVIASKEVPAGKYALEFLARADRQKPGFQEAFLANVVSYETSVRAVLSKVRLGEADAGIVYASDALSAGKDVITFALPANLCPRAVYFAGVVARCANPEAAGAFVALLASPKGLKILQKAGFEGPPAGGP